MEGDSIGLLFGQGALPWPCSVERISDEVIDEHFVVTGARRAGVGIDAPPHEMIQQHSDLGGLVG